MQYELDFDTDINVKGEIVLENRLTDPCEWCKRHEAEVTITRRGYDFGICNGCAEDDYVDWAEQMLDR